MEKITIEPTDKRPIEFTILIFILVIDVPFNIYDILTGNDDYPIISIIISCVFVLLAIGLWVRNEFARRAFVEFTGLLMLPVIFAFLLVISAVTEGAMSISESAPLVLALLTLCILFFYLRSERLLRYYWADEIRKNA